MILSGAAARGAVTNAGDRGHPRPPASFSQFSNMKRTLRFIYLGGRNFRKCVIHPEKNCDAAHRQRPILWKRVHQCAAGPQAVEHTGWWGDFPLQRYLCNSLAGLPTDFASFHSLQSSTERHVVIDDLPSRHISTIL